MNRLERILNVHTFKINAFMFLLAATLLCLTIAGCYRRTTAPTYSFDESEVETIRQQLGAKTADKEYVNKDEEDEDSDDDESDDEEEE